MEAAHTDLTEVTRVVLVDVGSVVVLTTGHTTTTGVLYNEDRLLALNVLIFAVVESRLHRESR